MIPASDVMMGSTEFERILPILFPAFKRCVSLPWLKTNFPAPNFFFG